MIRHEKCECRCYVNEHKGYMECEGLAGECYLLRDDSPDEMDLARDAAIRKDEEERE